MDFLSRLLDDVADHLEIPRARLDDIEYKTRQASGKDRHYIVSLEALQSLQRKRRVFDDFRSGIPTAEIAERVGLSHRRINQILSGSPMP